MTCPNCGKDFGGEGTSLIIKGESTLKFCSVNCFCKALKKATRAIKIMDKKQYKSFLDKLSTEENQ